MPEIKLEYLNFAVALGVGILIGAERERRKGEGPSRGPAGIRTFAVTSVAGAVAFTLGSELLLAIVTAAISGLTAVAYWRTPSEDPGLTSEIALISTVLLGGLATQQPGLAAGLGVTLAILLAARTPIHHFVRSVLTQTEVADALMFAAATLVVLPLMPDRPIGPYAALNLYKMWIVVILVMGIGGLGYVATRSLGPRFGLPITGVASGFISSTATIAAMGARVGKNHAVLKPAIAGAVLSTIATVIQLALVLAAVSPATLRAMAPALSFAAIAAVIYGAAFTIGALREATATEGPEGHAFSLGAGLAFTFLLSAVLVATAALQHFLGENGVVMAAAMAGFVDTHSAAISVASLVAAGKINPSDAIIPVLAGLSTNTVSKMILAVASGGRSFALRVIPGLIFVLIAAWAAIHVGP
jgi:uncharacterized membrane protein (DUF4010 family)